MLSNEIELLCKLDTMQIREISNFVGIKGNYHWNQQFYCLLAVYLAKLQIDNWIPGKEWNWLAVYLTKNQHGLGENNTIVIKIAMARAFTLAYNAFEIRNQIRNFVLHPWFFQLKQFIPEHWDQLESSFNYYEEYLVT